MNGFKRENETKRETKYETKNPGFSVFFLKVF